MAQFRFRLSPGPTQLLPNVFSAPEESSPSPAASGSSSGLLFSSFVVPGYDISASAPAPAPKPAIGSYEYDQTHGYDLHWESQTALEAWVRQEQLAKTIELRKTRTRPNKATGDHVWTSKIIYKCARDGTGGKSKYKKKHNRSRKVASKRIGCCCDLTVKIYPGRQDLLGKYRDKHSHEIGNGNVLYTAIPEETRAQIEDLVRLGLKNKEIVSLLYLTCSGNPSNARLAQTGPRHVLF